MYLETMDALFNSDTKSTLIDGRLQNLLPIKQLSASEGDAQ